MSAVSADRMTVDDFLAWADGRPGHYELFEGVVHAMGPERVLHGKIKLKVAMALAAEIARRGLSCHALPDGMTIRIDAATAYEPDALVYCGPELPSQALDVPNPAIVVEVLSDTTCHIDVGRKLAGYFSLPSLCHYLIVEPNEPLVIHHARDGGDSIRTRIIREGTIALTPPGLDLSLADIYG